MYLCCMTGVNKMLWITKVYIILYELHDDHVYIRIFCL